MGDMAGGTNISDAASPRLQKLSEQEISLADLVHKHSAALKQDEELPSKAPILASCLLMGRKEPRIHINYGWLRLAYQEQVDKNGTQKDAEQYAIRELRTRYQDSQ